MRTGKLADLLCTDAWQVLYTVPKGEQGVVSIHVASSDGSAVEFQIRHVKQGNNQTGVPHDIQHNIISPYTVSTGTLTVKELGVDSLDDILITADVADILVASVNTQGMEYKHGNQGVSR